MNGLASRVAAPEPTPSVSPAAPVPAPARELGDATAPSTRDRIEASFGEPAAPTTRERIVNRARVAEAEAAPPADVAPVIDLAREREARRPEPAAGPELPERPLAPVIPLEPEPLPVARAPPAADREETEAPSPGGEVAGEESARAPPEEAATDAAAPEEPAAAEAAEPEPEPEAAPEEAAPEPAAAPGPEDDPAFQAMVARTDRNATRTKDHQPSDVGAATAQGASEPDVQMDVGSQAAGDQVLVMGDKKPGEFDPVAFKAAVKKAVDGMAPPATLEEADEFEKTGKAAGATAAIRGIVTTGKAGSERDIKVATETTPDPAGRTPKTVAPMVNDSVGPPLPGVDAQSALPGLRPDSEIDLSAGPLEIKRKLAEAKVTEPQLAEGNEPEFNSALDATQQVRDHAATAPAGYREQEQVVLAQGRAGAEQVAATQTDGMRGSRAGALDVVLKAKDKTKADDKAIYDDVHGRIIGIHTRAQADVQKILGLLDGAVETLFKDGEAAARKAFEADVDRKMKEYKRKRYKGLWGKGKWLKDRFFDLPSSVNKFYEDSRNDYLAAMDRVIETIATTVGMLLGAAHLRILVGRDEVTAFVAGLPEATRKLGTDAATDLDHKFDDLASDVDAKRDELVDTVARLYVDSRGQLDERIKELKEANKGLVSRAIDAVIGVLKTIYELGKLLLRVLLKAASAIGDILGHPIRFLGNLVGAVKGGLERFVGRIGVHLQKAMLDLLFGELGSAGIRMPKALDFAGILDLVLQVLGLTYDGIRERLVNRFGAETVARMEETVDVFKTIVSDGLGGLWSWIADKLGDLEDLVIGKIKEYVIERVIKAGIGYVLALLNPAAAFIKACQGIYQIVMFVVERARQIAAFVESILDSISAIAQGNVGAAVERIESALADGLSLAIAFLARLANLGALSEKMRSIIAALRKPVTRAVDLVIFGAAEVYRRTAGRLVTAGREKAQAGLPWAKAKVAPPKEPAPVKVPPTELPRAPPTEADSKPEIDKPVRLAEDGIDPVPGEHHTVFALLSPGEQVDIGMSSTPQRIDALVRGYEPRIDLLPDVPPPRRPPGWQPQDRPRGQARNLARVILPEAAALELAFERQRAQTVQRRRPAQAGSPAPPPAGTVPVDLKTRLAALGDVVQAFLRLFRLYERPAPDAVPGEPAGGQKLTSRIWAEPDSEGFMLPAGGRLGTDPRRPREPGFDYVAPDPELAPPTRGAVDPGGAGRARGVVEADPFDVAQPSVRVRTWAVGDTPYHAANTSHTERHFCNWFQAQGADFAARVTTIELRSVLSPCSACTPELSELAGNVGKARRQAGRPAASLVVLWDRVYETPGQRGRAAATTSADIGDLRAAQWFADGPMP